MKAFAEALAPAMAVLDDELPVTTRLSVECRQHGQAFCETATTYREFKDIVETYELDAVSIDWEVHGVEKGKECLMLLGRRFPEVSTVVFTQHERRLTTARAFGADACLVKSMDGSLDEFRGVMRHATRTGLARRIAKRLVERGEHGVPTIPRGRLVDGPEEERLCELAIRTSDNLRQRGDDDHVLIGLLIRRGWWEGLAFELRTYARMSAAQKLRHLAIHAALQEEDLSLILEIQTNVLNQLDTVPEPLAAPQSITESADWLLSILAYVLRQCDYKPALMPQLINAQRVYARSADRPPWDEVGLRHYLRSTGRSGLSSCVRWIRAN